MFRLGWFLTTGFGVYGWGEPWSGNVKADVGRPGLFVDMARSLEAAGFDYLMFEDSSVLPDIYEGTFRSSVETGAYVRFDPMPLMPAVAAATRHIGIVATVATSFYPPFIAARLYQTLDHLTEGRIGANVVTASPDRAAQNFGLDKHYEHDKRYQMADEWVRAVKALWGSWEPGALQLSEASGLFADHTKIHPVEFEGEFYRTRGPLNLPPGPQQGEIVICQAGGSPAGRHFGALHADTIIAAPVGIDQMRDYREDISRRLLEIGRKPSEVKVLFLVSPILGATDADAERKREEIRAAQATAIDQNLAVMSYFTSMDFSKFDLDGPMPDMSKNNGHQSTMDDYAKSGPTLREIAAAHRAIESVELVGSPATVATQMKEAMEYVGGDGFLIASPVTRGNIVEIAEGLAPELRRRGLIRDGYRHSTFRENLLDF